MESASQCTQHDGIFYCSNTGFIVLFVKNWCLTVFGVLTHGYYRVLILFRGFLISSNTVSSFLGRDLAQLLLDFCSQGNRDNRCGAAALVEKEAKPGYGLH